MNKELIISAGTKQQIAAVSSLVATVTREPVRKVDPVVGRGYVNNVFDVKTERGRFIVRSNASVNGFSSYYREKWAIDRARERGVPVPSIIAISATESHVFMLYPYIVGVSASEYLRSLNGIWKRLGRYARIINSIETTGVGGTLTDSSSGGFAKSWEEWVEGELGRLFKDDTFVRHAILDQQQFTRAWHMLEGLFGWSFRPSLSHGNLSLDNTIVGRDGTLSVIDWGNSVSHRSPHFDLAEVCAWNNDPAVTEAFSNGYGISQAEFETMKSHVDTLQVLRILDCVRWNLKRKGAQIHSSILDHGRKKLKVLLQSR